MNPPIRRRDALKATTCGLGYLAFADLCVQQARADYRSPLAPKSPHHSPKAKNFIFLHMRGGPSHMETFEYKPS